MIFLCRCFWRPLCLPRGFKCSHLLHSSRAAPLLAFAEEFVSVQHYIIHPPRLLQSYQRLLVLTPFPIFLFLLFNFAVLHSGSFHPQVHLPHSVTGRHLTRTEVQRHKLNQAEIHPGPAACVLAKPANAPYCYCAMEGLPGTERQSGRRKIPLIDQMLASSWHMPTSCRGVGGNQFERGRWEKEGFV